VRRAAALLLPTLRDLLPRVLALLAFSVVFLASAATSAAFFKGAEGHVEIGQMFAVGGYPLPSALLLLGWLLGRLPVIAILVLCAGLFSHDRARGYARLYYVRPVSPTALYGLRFATLAAVAFVICAVVMPLFDLLMLGEWAGPATLVLIATNILVYGGLTALLSVWTRADAWVALLLACIALLWHALLRAGTFAVPDGPRLIVSALLPPQGSLYALENAFGSLHPIPWGDVAHAGAWGLVMLALAALSLRFREV
jgi:hypothetical protein